MTSVRQRRSIRVVSWAGGWGRALAEAVSAPFTEATGIHVEPVRHVGLRLPAPLTSALERGERPPVDVVWCNSGPALRAAAMGWCVPLRGLPVLDQLVERARPHGHPDWPIVKAYIVHYVLVYRSCLYAGEPPRTWEVLARPEHTGRVVLYPGGKGFLPVAQILGGGRLDAIPHDMDACWSTVRRIARQLGRPDYSIGLGAPIQRGEIDLCYRALTNALAFVADGLDVEWAVPAEGVADTTDALWVPRGLPDEEASWARQYIAFAMSAPIQERWCAMLGALPLHPSASAPSVLRARGLPSHPDDVRGVLHVPEQVEAEHELGWEATFDTICRSEGSTADHEAPLRSTATT